MAGMGRGDAAQKIVNACLQAQAGGQKIYGVAGLITWTGMSHSQVWRGLNHLRDTATQWGHDLIAYVDGYYVVGDLEACITWSVNRMLPTSTSCRRIEENNRAVAALIGTPEAATAARSAAMMVSAADKSTSDLLALRAALVKQRAGQP